MMHVGVPMTVSLMIHLALILLLALQAWALVGDGSADQGFEVGITALDDPFDGALRWPGEENLDLANAEVAEEADPFRYERRADLNTLVQELSNPAAETSTGGFGLGDSGRSGILGVGSGSGSGGGSGLGPGFGTGERGASAGVWNLRVAGRNFAYVIDFSGSIIVAVDDLKRELRRSIGRLRSEQNFDVFVFYSTGDQTREKFVTESYESKLVPATADHKRRFFEWLERQAPRGSTEPLAAMRRALSLKPDAVFFFSDGYFDEDVVDAVERANRPVGAQIHCLVFDEVLLQDMSEHPRLTDGARRLKRISDASNGRLKVVTGADLAR